MTKRVLNNSHKDRPEEGIGMSPIPSFMQNSNHIKCFILLLCGLMLISISIVPIACLEVSHLKTGKVVGRWRLAQGQSFTIDYTHSVALTPVYEIYHIGEGLTLILDETLFYSYGAGLPATTPYDFEMTPEGFRIFNINQSFPSVVYRTAAVVGEHQLTIDDKTISFLSFSTPGTAVEFKAVRRSTIRYVLGEVKSWLMK